MRVQCHEVWGCAVASDVCTIYSGALWHECLWKTCFWLLSNLRVAHYKCCSRSIIVYVSIVPKFVIIQFSKQLAPKMCQLSVNTNSVLISTCLYLFIFVSCLLHGRPMLLFIGWQSSLCTSFTHLVLTLQLSLHTTPFKSALPLWAFVCVCDCVIAKLFL